MAALRELPSFFVDSHEHSSRKIADTGNEKEPPPEVAWLRYAHHDVMIADRRYLNVRFCGSHLTEQFCGSFYFQDTPGQSYTSDNLINKE